MATACSTTTRSLAGPFITDVSFGDDQLVVSECMLQYSKTRESGVAIVALIIVAIPLIALSNGGGFGAGGGSQSRLVQGRCTQRPVTVYRDNRAALPQACEQPLERWRQARTRWIKAAAATPQLACFERRRAILRQVQATKGVRARSRLLRTLPSCGKVPPESVRKMSSSRLVEEWAAIPLQCRAHAEPVQGITPPPNANEEGTHD